MSKAQQEKGASPDPEHLSVADPLRVRAEQTRLLYGQLWIALGFTLLVAFILCLIEWSVVDHARILVWLALLIPVTLGRGALGVAFRTAVPADAAMEPWRWRFFLGTVLAGIAWGSAGILLFPADDMAHKVFLAFVLGGMAAGAVTTLTYAWYTIVVFLILSLSPLVLRLFAEATPMGLGMGTMMLLHLSGLAASARRTYTNNLQNITLRLEAVSREEALIKARDAAQQAVQAKSRFLATMSHEIRTPMNGVLGMAELLSHTPLNAEQRDQLETIRSSAGLLLNVINDILDLSKIEAGKVDLRPAGFDLELAIHDAVRLLAREAARKGLLVDVHYGPDVPRDVVGDRDRIRQVLMNLVGNAVKFTQRGHILVRAGGTRAADGSVHLRIEVEDTGIGIAPEDQDRLFDSFTQADGSHERRYGGTGLGLAISRGLARRMGGEIGLESTPDAGSTFWLDLTLPAEQATSDASYEALAEVQAFLVGGNSRPLNTIAHQLAQLGLEVERVDAECAPERLHKARDAGRAVPIMLVDGGMPTDGLTRLIRMVRASAGNTVLLGLKPLGRHDDPSQSEVFDARLVMPVPRDQLAHALLRLLAPAQPTSAPAEAGEPQAGHPSPRASGQVLLVEDNPVNQEVARSMLEHLDLKVTLAENGREALEKCRASRPDLVLMDCEMPELNGYEATQRLRAQEQGEADQIPVVALTANAFADNRRKCLDAGMNDYLPKPFTLEELSQIVTRWLPADTRDTTTK